MTKISEDFRPVSPDGEVNLSSWIESVKPIKFKEAYFFKLSSQGNIYCTSLYESASGFFRLLVASLKRKVCWLWFDGQDESGCHGNVAVSEMTLTHVPPLCEVVSVHVMDRTSNRDEVIVGVTLTKEFERSVTADASLSSHFINIYSQSSSSSSSSISSCKPAHQLRLIQQLQLSFVPYQLTAADTLIDETKQSVFVLSGSDGSVHVYGEDRKTNTFSEKSTDQLFPELADLPSLAMWIDFRAISDSQRVSAVGCECGALRVAVVTWPKPARLSVTHTWSASQHDLITSLRLFPAVGTTSCDTFNLLVTCAQLPAVVYSDVTGCFQSQQLKPEQRLPLARDVVTCSCVADVNMDGCQEILLGTYSQELLVFAFSECSGWTEVMKLSFSRPLISLVYADITADGVRELCVVTTYGVHVFQHDIEETCALVCKRLEQKNVFQTDWLERLTLSDSTDTGGFS